MAAGKKRSGRGARATAGPAPSCTGRQAIAAAIVAAVSIAGGLLAMLGPFDRQAAPLPGGARNVPPGFGPDPAGPGDTISLERDAKGAVPADGGLGTTLTPVHAPSLQRVTAASSSIVLRGRSRLQRGCCTL